MNKTRALLAGACAALLAAAQPAAAAPHAEVTEKLRKDLADLPGKEGLLITVTYPPGAVDPVHRHDAHAFLYVLEGEVVMQVRGGPPVTLKAGDTFNGSGRRPPGGPQRQQHEAGQVRRGPAQEAGRAGAHPREVTARRSPCRTP